MASTAPPHHPYRLYAVAGPGLRAALIVDTDDLVRAASDNIAGWALGRPLGQVVRRAALRGATVTAVDDDLPAPELIPA